MVDEDIDDLHISAPRKVILANAREIRPRRLRVGFLVGNEQDHADPFGRLRAARSLKISAARGHLSPPHYESR
jgi:hypothetical protein